MEWPRPLTCGVDEAGRGSWAGEVVAAAVLLPSIIIEDAPWIHEIHDSKKLTPNKRQRLAALIKEYATAYGIGVATPQEIDNHNILQATYMAMHRALDAVSEKQTFEYIDVDGNKFKPYVKNDRIIPHECIIKGDSTHIHIAAASILAKTHHDELIQLELTRNPQYKHQYGWHTNQGYGTAAHLKGLQTYGVTPYHRMSYEPVKKEKEKEKEQII
jgi:ribonuclease HII